MYFFINKKIHKFDPHIGDTLCQIRAYKNYLLYDFYQKNHADPNQVYEIYKKFYTLKYTAQKRIMDFEKLALDNKSRYHKDLDGHESIQNFIEKNSLSFKISEDLLYLIQSYILTEFSQVDNFGVSRGVNYEIFSKKANISKSFAKKLMHTFQQRIAKISCDFIFSLLKDIPEYSISREILKNLVNTDNDKREALPCYEVTKILITHILKYNGLILLLVENESTFEEEKFFFSPNKDGTDFKLQEKLCDKSYHNPCLTIKGNSGYFTNNFLSKTFFIQQLMKVGLKNVILANMAKHPQYSARKNDMEGDNPYKEFTKKNEFNKNFVDIFPLLKKSEDEFLLMKKLAITIGCCLENSSLFSIKHIFCDETSNHATQSSASQSHNTIYSTIGIEFNTAIQNHHFHKSSLLINEQTYEP